MTKTDVNKKLFGEKFKEKTGNVKRSVSDYKTAIKQAYAIGYRQGVKDYEALPKRKGSALAAKTGYGRGLRDHKKSDKYNERIKR